MVHQILKDETCSGCGNYSWYAFSENPNIDFEMHEHTCEACAHKERWEKTSGAEGGKDKIDQPGSTWYPVPVPIQTQDEHGNLIPGVLPDRTDWLRERYDKRMAELAQKKAVSGE